MGSMERVLAHEVEERRRAAMWLAALMCAMAVVVFALIVSL